jgi:hypothetical protein
MIGAFSNTFASVLSERFAYAILFIPVGTKLHPSTPLCFIPTQTNQLVHWNAKITIVIQ